MNVFSMLLKSFYDPRAYAIVLAKWGIVKFFLYYVLLSVIAAFAIVFSSMPVVNSFCDGTLSKFSTLAEGISISNGKITPDDFAPRFLKDNAGVNTAAISPRALTADESKDVVIAFEKDRLNINLPNYENYSTKLIDIAPLSSNNPIPLVSLIPTESQIKYAIVPLFATIGALSMNALYIFIMGIAAFIMSIVNFPTLRLLGSFKFATLAITPAELIDALVVSVFGIPMQGIFFAIISCGMMFYVFTSWRKHMMS